jgi:phosphoribosylanthranilate isomerase
VIGGMFGDTPGADGRIRVKICGITNPRDAMAAIDCGADAIGLNFYPRSKRFIAIDSARDWIETLPSKICKVAILVDPTLEEATRIGKLPFIDALQLHGQESPEFCQRLSEGGIRFAKAMAVVNSKSLADLPSFSTQTFVLDSAVGGEFGGSGKTLSWSVARNFVERHPDFRIILAGGLTPENVGGAIDEVRPFGIDVSSGVESSPGCKDAARMQAFISAARTGARRSID